jgi:hypothetical protein
MREIARPEQRPGSLFSSTGPTQTGGELVERLAEVGPYGDRPLIGTVAPVLRPGLLPQLYGLNDCHQLRVSRQQTICRQESRWLVYRLRDQEAIKGSR